MINRKQEEEETVVERDTAHTQAQKEQSAQLQEAVPQETSGENIAETTEEMLEKTDVSVKDNDKK